MKDYAILLAGSLLEISLCAAPAAEYYANVNNPNPQYPYSDWSTAATNIQDAIDAASDSDTIWVTNGIYATGGKVVAGDLTNRVVLDKAVTVQSVNGYAYTFIQGTNGTPVLGNSAVRCAWLTNGAVLKGFTLRGGATRTDYYNTIGSGGGAWCTSTNATIVDCLIGPNAASYAGGGVYQGTLWNCRVLTNTLPGGYVGGGGTYQSSVNNSLFAGNYSYSLGSAAYGGTLRNCAVIGHAGLACVYANLVNCTVAFNSSGVDAANLTNCVVYANYNYNYYGAGGFSHFSHCCTTPQPSGPGNISADPQLLADGFHVASASPCRGAGTSDVATGTDIDGQPWSNPPSIGCYEWQPAPAIESPVVQFGSVPPPGFILLAPAAGQEPFTCYWTKDGLPLQDDGHYSSSGTTRLIVSSPNPADAGSYQVVVSNSYGMATSRVTQLTIHCVDAAGQAPQAPYLSWAAAATNIQDAVDAASPTDIVLVTNGVYGSGGRVMSGDLTNRVVLDKSVFVTSMNGYAKTVIQGGAAPATCSPTAVRCAWIMPGAQLIGFTLRYGATRLSSDIWTGAGGGIWCTVTNPMQPVAMNCLIVSNSAFAGGGVYRGTYNNCVLLANSMLGAPAGIAHGATLRSCTIVSNTSFGTYGSLCIDCISYYNTYKGGVANSYSATSDTYSYCCTTPLPSGVGNFTNAPQLLADAIHLSATSPCLGAGTNLAGGIDIDGEPWGNPPSIGCDEVLPVGPLSVTVSAYPTQLLPNRNINLVGTVTGRASRLEWSFGDGSIATNVSFATSHAWTNAGDYTVTCTAYNTDNPLGVAANTTVHVLPLAQPLLEAPCLATNGFQFQFSGQSNATYLFQMTTILSSPVIWQTLQTLTSTGGVVQLTDTPTNTTQFYRLTVQ